MKISQPNINQYNRAKERDVMHFFQTQHAALDCSVIGLYAFSTELGKLRSKTNEAITVFESEKNMKQWLAANAILRPYETRSLSYGDLMSSIIDEDASFLVEESVASRVLDLLTQDRRFQP